MESDVGMLTLEDLKRVGLEILTDVHEFCERNDIWYSLGYGSLLGAVRHNGFIPWDDDIDIMMPRPDFERFVSTYHSDRFEVISP